MSNYIDTVQSLIDAWKNDDIDGVMNHLHDNIEWHYLVGMPPVTSKAQAREFLETFGQGQKEKKWHINNHAQNGDKLLVEGVDDFVDAEGVRIQMVYMGIFEFKDGLIYRWRDYLDTGLAGKAKQGEAAPDYVQALINK